MYERAYDGEPWLDEYIDVPEVLCRALDVRPRTTRLTVLDRLAEELGVAVDRPSALSWDMLERLLDPLAAAMEEGPVVLDERPRGMVEVAVANFDAEDLRRLLIELGWGSAVIRNVTVSHLADHLRKELAGRLLPKVQRMTLRWGRRGFFRHGRQAS